MKILGFDFGPAKNIAPDNVVKESQKKISEYPTEQQKFRTREDIRKMEVAIDLAQNLTSHNREDSHRIYERILDDPMLTSQWETRKLKTMNKEFRLVDSNAEEDLDRTKIFETGWFMDYANAILDSQMWGFTLVEFGAIDEAKFLPWIDEKKKVRDAVTIVNRDYVKPEWGMVVKQPSSTSGIAINDPLYSDWLIFEGKANDPGLLKKLMKYSLFKDNVLGNWSEWAEVYGMDIRIGKTDAQGEDRRKFVKAIRDLGANGNGVFGTDDELEYIGTQKTDAYRVYHEFARYIDEQISKLIFGQDVVSNNTGKVVGTVGENISNLYGDVDSKFLERNINDKLIPLMINLGVTELTGFTFAWDNTESLSLEQQINQDKIIAEMGFNISADYIMATYGTELEEGANGDFRVAQPMPMPAGPANVLKPVDNISEEIERLYNLNNPE